MPGGSTRAAASATPQRSAGLENKKIYKLINRNFKQKSMT